MHNPADTRHKSARGILFAVTSIIAFEATDTMEHANGCLFH